jgi:hypothetical protein
MFSFFKSNREANAPALEMTAVDERRREERVAAQGEVILILETPQIFEIRGRLLDKSASGFRASHMYPALTSGQVIRCRLEGVEILVRVVWNRIIEEEVESGFLIV